MTDHNLYKSKWDKPSQSALRRKSRGGTMVGLFIGLVIGVLISAGVVWYMNKMPIPFQTKAKPEGNGEARPSEGAKPGAVSGPLPGKPGDKVEEKPRFEFYKILPGADEAAPKKEPVASVPAAPAAPGVLYLQVGAFQNAADADNLKARLALIGVEASVQQVTVPDKGAMHRVRVGPYRSVEEMSSVRTQLAQNGIQATVVRVKDGAN